MANSLTTWYVRDAQGNTIAVYDNKLSQINWREQHLYGSDKLGMWQPDMNIANNLAPQITDTAGHLQYEGKNHLGNVIITMTDKRLPYTSTGTLSYYLPDITTSQDYYAYGALMPGRTFTASLNYRYGFNGKENDNEVKGVGNQQDYGMRIYDPRVGRFLSSDPLAHKYPMLTPYQFASNSPLSGVDFDGLEYLRSDVSTVEFGYGSLRLKLANLAFLHKNNIILAQQDPNQWTVRNDGTRDLGVDLTIANVDLIKPVWQNLEAKDIPSENLPNFAKGQTQSGTQSEAYNRAGRRDIDRKGPIVDVPAGRGGVATAAAVLDVAYLALDQAKMWSYIDDDEDIKAHTKIAQKVVQDFNRALNAGMIPVKYQNASNIATIMNVILQGVNNTNNKELYDIGMKIYNKYKPQPLIIKSGLDAQPSKPMQPKLSLEQEIKNQN